MEDFLATVLPRPAGIERYLWAVTSKSFYASPNFVGLRKMCLKHIIKIFPLENAFCPQTLKPGYGPDSAKIVSAMRICCFEDHSPSRCSITSRTLLHKSLLGGAVSVLGGPELGCYGTANEQTKKFTGAHHCKMVHLILRYT